MKDIGIMILLWGGFVWILNLIPEENRGKHAVMFWSIVLTLGVYLTFFTS